MSTRVLVLGVLVAGGGIAHADNKRCVIEAKQASAIVVEVAPKGAARIPVRVADGATLTLTPQAGPAPVKVHVKGALEFDATIAAAHLPLRTATEVDATNAMIHLARDVGGAPGGLVIKRTTKGGVEVDLALGDVTLRGLVLPCTALTLDPVAPPEVQHGTDEGEERFVPTGKVLHLRGFPGGKGTQIDIELGGAPEALELRRSDTQGGWWRVSHTWLDGTSIDGWVSKAELEPAKKGALRDGGFEPTVTGPCGRGVSLVRASETIGKGTVAPGTKVFAARGIGPWATVRTAEPLTVRYLSRDEWVELIGVPGLASGAGECVEKSTALEDAWVPRSAVKLLDDAPPPAADPPPPAK